MFLSYSMIYYFGPDLKERKWYWVTLGAVAGVVLWLLASLGFRIYLHFFNSYSATYGSLGAVIILMLWLYITGFAILIGGEVNWLIENRSSSALLWRRLRCSSARNSRFSIDGVLIPDS
jgi:membrane protein